MCREQVAWAVQEKRTFLRQRIEARLVALHLAAKDFPAALSLISKLLTEVCLAALPLTLKLYALCAAAKCFPGSCCLIWRLSPQVLVH